MHVHIKCIIQIMLVANSKNTVIRVLEKINNPKTP